MNGLSNENVGGLLREQVESFGTFDLGIRDNWTWIPSQPVDAATLQNVSPTTEYSTEGGEN